MNSQNQKENLNQKEVEEIKKRINFDVIKYEIEKKPGLLSGLILKYLEKRKKQKNKNTETQNQENKITKTQFDGGESEEIPTEPGETLTKPSGSSIKSSELSLKPIKPKPKRKSLLLRILFLIPGRRRISINEYYKFSERDRQIYLAYFFGKKIPRLFLGLATIIISILLSLFVVFDTRKKFTYEPIRTLDYKEIEWNEKANNEGYSMYSDNKASFEWKAVIQPPNKSFLFKVEDISKITIHIKNLSGSIEIPSYAQVKEEKIHTMVSGSKKIISETREVTIEAPTHFASLLGISIISPHQADTITINGKKLNIATIQLPEKSKIIKIGDGLYPAGIYKIDKLSYFFHNFSNPAIVYYQAVYHIAIQLLITFLGICGFIVILLGVKRIKIPSLKLETRHFVYFFCAVTILMLFFAAIAPNPYSIILNFDKRDTQYQTDQFITNEKNIPLYLWWALAATRSIDTIIIGDASPRLCGSNTWRHWYLTKFSVQKFIVLEEFKENTCARLVQDMSPKKVVIVPQAEVGKELAKLKSRFYPWSFVFIFNIKSVFILSNIIVFLATMFLVWKAFSIRKIRDIFLLAFYGFITFFVITLLFVATGFLAHMPIGYHGISNVGLIMSNYVLPGVFRGGNNLRTLFAFAGCFSALIFLRNVRPKINFLVYPYFIILGVLFLILPQTEYFTKRLFLTAMSAEAYVWDYKIDAFNPLDFYQSLRDADPIGYTRNAFSKETEAERKMIYAKSLRDELRFGEATQLYKDIIYEYKDYPKIVAQAHYELGELYYQQKTINVLNKKIAEIELVLPRDEYLRKAIDEFTLAIDIDPNAEYIPEAIYRLILCHLALRQFEQASLYTQTFLEKFPNHDKTVYVEFLLIDALIGAGKHEEAIQKYQILLGKYPERKSSEALLKAAYIYQKLGNKEQAIKIYFDLISSEPENLALMRKVYSNLQYLVSRKEKANIENSLLAFEKEMTKNYLEAIAMYDKLDESFENETFNANNLFRKGESYRTLALLTYTTPEKIKYQNASQENYKKIVERYPKNPLTKIAKQRLGQIEVLEKKDVILSYDLGKESQAFDEKDIVPARKEMNVAGSLRIQIPKLKTECSNKICEIGENPTNCSSDCNLETNKIIIRARGIKAGEEWPKMQLWIGKKFIKEWKVDTADYLDFSMPFELPDRAFQLDIVYPNDDDDPTDTGRGLFVESVTLNNQKIILEEKFETFKYLAKATPQAQAPQQPTVEAKKAEEAGLSYPPNFRSLYKFVHESRGMVLYFAGTFCLCIMFLLRKNLRTFVSPVIFFFISRGMTRIAEQDIFRAWSSIWSGIKSSLQIAIALLVINIVLFIIFNPLKTVEKIKLARKLFKKPEPLKQKTKNVLKLLKPSV